MDRRFETGVLGPLEDARGVGAPYSRPGAGSPVRFCVLLLLSPLLPASAVMPPPSLCHRQVIGRCLASQTTLLAADSGVVTPHELSTDCPGASGDAVLPSVAFHVLDFQLNLVAWLRFLS